MKFTKNDVRVIDSKTDDYGNPVVCVQVVTTHPYSVICEYTSGSSALQEAIDFALKIANDNSPKLDEYNFCTACGENHPIGIVWQNGHGGSLCKDCIVKAYELVKDK